MDQFFHSEGKIMQFLSTLADLVMLNLLTILCSLPIFTLGAAVTALYDAMVTCSRETEACIPAISRLFEPISVSPRSSGWYASAHCPRSYMGLHICSPAVPPAVS